MKKMIRSSEDIFGMSSIRGRFIKVENDVPFSFYYSRRRSSHGPRVKPILNPSKLNPDDVGILELCGEWKFTPGSKDKHYSSKVVKQMKEFFRKYIVLFMLVWDKHIDDPELEDYLRGSNRFT